MNTRITVWIVALSLLLSFVVAFLLNGRATSVGRANAQQDSSQGGSGSASPTAAELQPVYGEYSRIPETVGTEPDVPSGSVQEGEPFELAQLHQLQANLREFRSLPTVATARSVLCQEALVILHDKRDYLLLGPGPYSEDPRPGYYEVTRSSEFGIQLFYLSVEEFPEYATIVPLDVRAQQGEAQPELSLELYDRIYSRVSATLASFGLEAD